MNRLIDRLGKAAAKVTKLTTDKANANVKASLALALALAFSTVSVAQDRIEIDGYVKLLGTGTDITRTVPEGLLDFSNLQYTYFDYQVHNRFNIDYHISDQWRVKVGMRNRLFWGYQTSNLPSFKESIAADPGVVDMSFILVDGDDVFLHTLLDRAYVEYRSGDWEFVAGRQRINWGVNTVWNPNDLFNQYNYFDFDYEERPGADAVRTTRYLGYNSKIEVAAALDSANQVTAAGLYQFGKGSYDLQVLGGWFKNDLAVGAGWAGNLRSAGFKGEATYFHGLQNESPNAFLASFTIDYAFANSLYIAGSYLYNSGGSNQSNFLDFGGITNPANTLSAKNPFPFESTFFIASSYQITPLFRIDVSQMFTTAFDTYILIPSFTYSITQDLDALILGQIFFGNRIFELPAPLPTIDEGFGYVSGLGFVRLKYSF